MKEAILCELDRGLANGCGTRDLLEQALVLGGEFGIQLGVA